MASRASTAKKRGRKAYHDGVPFHANPECGLGDWQDWRAGWNDEQAKATRKARRKE